MVGAKDTDIDTILAQLTAARWYLDRAAGANDPESVRQDVRNARQACNNALLLLTQANLTDDQHKHVQDELAALRSRLKDAGESFQ